MVVERISELDPLKHEGMRERGGGERGGEASEKERTTKSIHSVKSFTLETGFIKGFFQTNIHFVISFYSRLSRIC